MKTFHIVIVITLMLSFIFNFNKGTANPLPEKKPRVLIRITFGAPPPDCTRMGICQVELLPGILRVLPGQANAQCAADESGSRLFMEIDIRDGIDTGTLKHYFDSGYLLLESAVLLPEEVTRALQIQSGSTIVPGRWDVTTTNGILTFTVHVK
jgi:hypothetical protein